MRHLTLLVALAITASMSVAAAIESGRVELTAALITPDLLIRPVPKHRFLIVPDPGSVEEPLVEIVTGFDGTAQLELAPGRYRIVSDQPLAPAFTTQFALWEVEAIIAP